MREDFPTLGAPIIPTDKKTSDPPHSQHPHLQLLIPPPPVYSTQLPTKPSQAPLFSSLPLPP